MRRDEIISKEKDLRVNKDEMIPKTNAREHMINAAKDGAGTSLIKFVEQKQYDYGDSLDLFCQEYAWLA